jgi:hypothetical protein
LVPLAYAELAVAKKTAVALKSPSLSFTEAGVSFASKWPRIAGPKGVDIYGIRIEESAVWGSKRRPFSAVEKNPST